MRRRSHRKRIILISLAGFAVVSLAALFGAYEYSTSPRFCNNCHIMEPYYQAWRTPSHYFVPCVECHYPPGTRDTIWAKFQAVSQVAKYVTRTYGSKPYAEIEDASCLRAKCHHERLLKGKVVFKNGIVFDHAPHLQLERRGRHLRCTSCHSQIVVGSHMEVTEQTCFLCHFKGKEEGRSLEPIGGCSGCHPLPEGDVEVGGQKYSHKEFAAGRGVRCQNCHLDTVEGKGEAPKERCFLCHNDPTRLERYGDLEFIHDNHITKHSIACERCHYELKHGKTVKVRPLPSDCTLCHTGKHFGQKEMYQGIGGKGVEAMPSSMYRAQVDCTGCHVVPRYSGIDVGFVGQTYGPSESACIKCHGDGYSGILESWQDGIAADLKKAEEKLATTDALLAKASKDAPGRADAEAKVNDARYNTQFVRLAKGIHNYDYALALLAKSIEMLDAVPGILAGNTPPGSPPTTESQKPSSPEAGAAQSTASPAHAAEPAEAAGTEASANP